MFCIIGSFATFVVLAMNKVNLYWLHTTGGWNRTGELCWKFCTVLQPSWCDGVLPPIANASPKVAYRIIKTMAVNLWGFVGVSSIPKIESVPFIELVNNPIYLPCLSIRWSHNGFAFFFFIFSITHFQLWKRIHWSSDSTACHASI